MKVLAFPVSQFNVDLPIFHQLPKDDAKALKAIIERDSSAQFSFDATLCLFHVVLSHAPSVLSLLTTLKFTNLTIGSKFLNHLSSLSSLTTLHLQNINSGDTIYDSLTFLHLISFVIINCSNLQALNMVVPSLHHFKAQHCSQLKTISLASAKLHSLYLSDLPLLGDHSVMTLIQSISVTSLDTIFIKTKEDTENIKALLERTSSSVHLTSWLASKFFFFILSHRFSDMNFITSLDLSGNNIGDEGTKNLSSLSSLITLNLSDNDIGDSDAKHLSSLSSLTTLNLYGNNIGAEGTKHLSSLSSLTTLNLSFNNIGAEGAKNLSSLSSLTTLDLWNNNIGDSGAKNLSSLSSLTTLDLRNNKIGAEGAKNLSSLSSLTTLNLWKNHIGAEGAKNLSSLSSLTTFDLRSNSVPLSNCRVGVGWGRVFSSVTASPDVPQFCYIYYESRPHILSTPPGSLVSINLVSS
jgi:Leucine-rich repeat (LRR) protein